MADRKATNKYYPPDWDPSKGSINKHIKSHPLRDRARRIDEGILVVRFEMPFNVWCLNCDNHIGMGVRYNAEKSKVGNYYSSPIYKFRMKCHLCDNYFEIQTEPSKFDYIILSGARKQIRSVENPDNGYKTIQNGENETKLSIDDAMSRLEQKAESKIQIDSQLPNLHELAKWRERHSDHYSANQLLRSHYREKRKKIEQKRDKDKIRMKEMSLKISLTKSSRQDAIQVQEKLMLSKLEKVGDFESRKKKDILSSSILPRRLIPSSSNLKIKQDTG